MKKHILRSERFRMVASFPMELGERGGNRWPPRGNLAISCSFPKRGSRVSDPGDRDTVLRLYAFAFTGRIGTPQCDEQAEQAASTSENPVSMLPLHATKGIRS